MATRYYLQSTSSSPITPAISSAWDFSISAFARYPTSTTKAGQTLSFISLDGNGDGADNDYCFGQWISGGIAAQTVGGTGVTVKIQMRCMQEAARVNAFLTATVRILSSDGTTVRGTVCSLTRDNTEMVSTTNEALATNRAWAVADSTAVTAQNGDIIVIEIGSGGDPSTGSGGNSHDSDICVGDASSTDLTLDNDMEVTNNNPYCEFEDDIAAATTDVEVEPGEFSAATSFQAPTVKQSSLSVTCGFIAAAATLLAPTVAISSVSVTPGNFSAASSFEAPTVEIYTPPVVMDSYTGGDVFYTIYAGEEMRSQSFLSPSTTHSIYDMAFRVKKSGLPVGDMTAELWTHTGTFGTSSEPGVLLATSDAVAISTLTTALSNVHFYFTKENARLIAPDTHYCMVLKYDAGNASNCLAWLVDNDSPSHGGNAAIYSGTTWTAAAGVDGWFFLYGTPIEPGVIDGYDDSNISTVISIYSGLAARSQSFTADLNCTLDNIEFSINKTGSPTGSVYAKAYTHSGTYGTGSVPTGTVLAISDAIDVTTVPGSYAFVKFNFTGNDRISLTKDENYCAVIEYASGNVSNCVSCIADNSSPTHDGNEAVYATSWTAASGIDLCFRVSGLPAAGDIEVEPDFYSAVGSFQAPTVQKGSLSLTPDEFDAAGSFQAPTVAISSVSVTPDEFTSVGSFQAPTVAISSVSVTPGFFSVVGSYEAPTVQKGDLLITPDEFTAVASAHAPTVELSSLDLSPAFASAIGSFEAPTVAQSSVSVSPTFASAVGSFEAPTVEIGGGSLELEPGEFTAIGSFQAPTVIQSSLSITPDEFSAAATAIAPVVQKGSLDLSPGFFSAATSALAPTVVKGSLAITPDELSAVGSFEAPTVAISSVSVTPGFFSAIGSMQAPSVVKGSLSIEPDEMSAVSSLQIGSVVKGSLSLEPGEFSAAGSFIAPTVQIQGGSVEVEPDEFTAVGSFNEPEVITTLTVAYYSDSNCDSDQNVYGGSVEGIGESWHCGHPGVLQFVRLLLSKTGIPGGFCYAEIYTHSGVFGSTSIPGSLLATSDAVGMFNMGAGRALQTFNFSGSDKIDLEPGVDYVVAIRYEDGDSSNYLKVGYDGSSPTSGGNYSQTNDHVIWSPDSDRDMIYYVHMMFTGWGAEPDYIYAIGQFMAPIVAISSISVSPAFMSAAGSMVAPTVQQGSLSITPPYIHGIGLFRGPTVEIRDLRDPTYYANAVLAEWLHTGEEAVLGADNDIVLAARQDGEKSLLVRQDVKVAILVRQDRKIDVT